MAEDFHLHLSFHQDHSCARPASPTALKTRPAEALAREDGLERDKRRSFLQEHRDKKKVHDLLEDMREKILINEDQKGGVEAKHSPKEPLPSL